jgi:hypothetical protein
MLIINNGVQKSGSSLVQRLLQKALKPVPPGAAWQSEGWSNPSVPPEKLGGYYKSGEWREQTVLLKMHLRFLPEFKFLTTDPDVRVVVSRRNLPDTVVSFFHHQVRLGKAQPENRKTWMETVGRARAFAAAAYQTSWRNQPNSYVVRFEDMLSDPLPNLEGLLAFLGHPVPQARCEKIIASTIIRRNKNAEIHDGAFVRTAGLSQAKQELPEDFYNELCRMDDELNALM